MKASRPDGPCASAEMDLLCACVSPGDAVESAEGVLAQRTVDWSRLLEGATRHRVLPLLHRVLSEVDWRRPGTVPAEYLRFLHRAQREIAAHNLRATVLLRRMQERMAAQGIRMIPLKGPALARQAYGCSSLRQFEDLDLLVRREELLQAVRVLEEDGYALRELPATVDRASYLATLQDWSLHKPGAPPVDLEPVVISHAFSTTGPVDLFAAACRPLDLGDGRMLQVPGPEAMFWAVALDGAYEMWFKLSAVADAARLLAMHREADWSGWLHQAESFGHGRCLRVGAALAARLLGVSLPAVLEEAVAADAVAQRLALEAAGRLHAMEPRPPPGARQKWFALRTLSRNGDRGRFVRRLLFVPGAYEFHSMPRWMPGVLRSAWRPLRLAWDVIGRGGRNRRVSALPSGRGR